MCIRDSLYDNENPLVKLAMDFEMHRGRNAVLTAYALGKTAVVTGCMPEEAMRTPLTAESIKARLSKLGGTQFYAGKISADIDDGLILSASAINDTVSYTHLDVYKRQEYRFRAVRKR